MRAGNLAGAARRRLGARQNSSPRDVSAWLVAGLILILAVPANAKLATQPAIFTIQGLPAWVWLVLSLGLLALVWLALIGLATLMVRRLTPRTYDIVVSSVTLLTFWFLFWNALARSGWLYGSMPESLSTLIRLGVGLMGGVVVTLIARRLRMGTVLLGAAAVAACLPFVTTPAAEQPISEPTVAFDSRTARPDVLWVISDELQYSALFDDDGQVRPQYPNLAALQADATTYTRAFPPANYTLQSIPSTLAGLADVSGYSTGQLEALAGGGGIVRWMGEAYSTVTSSDVFQANWDAASMSPFTRYATFLADLAAIAGRTSLAPAIADQLLPSIDGKWGNFWDTAAPAQGATAITEGMARARVDNPGQPVFALWHNMGTHMPWRFDFSGRQIYDDPFLAEAGTSLFPGRSTREGVPSTPELTSLQARLYAASAVEFDRRLGDVVNGMKADGTYDNTMIVVMSDHGRAIGEPITGEITGDFGRTGTTLDEGWSDVAHIPLVVKAPGQDGPEVVDQPRSTGQIAASVLAAAGASAAGGDLAPGLDQPIEGPVFTLLDGRTWTYDGRVLIDSWRAEDLAAASSSDPFAIGLDPAQLGAPVPDGWQLDATARVAASPGDSDLTLLAVTDAGDTCRGAGNALATDASGAVLGAVLWEDAGEPTAPAGRGWAVVPVQPDAGYQVWCPAP